MNNKTDALIEVICDIVQRTINDKNEYTTEMEKKIYSIN